MPTEHAGGETWQPHRPVQWGLAPLWAPVLHWDAAGATLALYYSESRKALSPGGDVKRMVSSDGGATWSPPSLVWTHEDHEPVPKVTSSRPVRGMGGDLFLAVHLEPHGAHTVFNKATYSELEAGRADMPRMAVPPGAPPASPLSAAGESRRWGHGSAIEGVGGTSPSRPSVPVCWGQGERMSDMLSAWLLPPPSSDQHLDAMWLLPH